jgi:hypothetical protein
MSSTGLDVFDKTLQTTHVWLNELCEEICPDAHLAWHVLGAVLRATRDRLPMDLAAHRFSSTTKPEKRASRGKHGGNRGGPGARISMKPRRRSQAADKDPTRRVAHSAGRPKSSSPMG